MATIILQPGETVRYHGKLHWMVYGRALSYTAAAAIAFFVGGFVMRHGGSQEIAIGAGLVAVLCLIAAACSAVRALIIRWLTEVVVTDRRVIYAGGFIARHAVEMNVSKIESVDVDQTMLGRFLGFGNVTIRGTGSTLEPFRLIDRPMTFRNAMPAA